MHDEHKAGQEGQPGVYRLLRQGVDFDRGGRKNKLCQLEAMEGFFPLARILDRLPVSESVMRRLSSDPESERFFFVLKSETSKRARRLYVDLRGLAHYCNQERDDMEGSYGS